MNIPKGKVKGVFLIRDSEGNVKFDDYSNIPSKFLPYLTSEDLAYIQQQIGD